MVRLLTAAERETLRPIYEQEFDSELPEVQQANIIGVVDNGEIQGFITTEILLTVDMLWVSPEAEHKTSIIRDLIRYLIANVPQGSSVVSIAPPRRKKLFAKLGFREVEGTFYRMDV